MISVRPCTLVSWRSLAQFAFARSSFPSLLSCHIDIGIVACHPTTMRVLDQVQQACLTKHYSQRTEESYTRWIEQFLRFHRDAAGEWIHPRDTYLRKSGVNRGTYHLFPSPSLPPRPTLHQISASYPFRESNELGAPKWIRIYDPQMPSRAGPWPIGWMTHDSSTHRVTQYVFQCCEEVSLTKRAGREPPLK